MGEDISNPFDKAYKLTSMEETKQLYADWSDTYDSQLAETGYATPQRCADALALYCADKSTPILDIGCGTGLSGAALLKAGFSTIDGTDPSEDMIAIAGPKNLYRDLSITDLSNQLDFPIGTYAAMIAVGVINIGHAPGSTIHLVLGKLAIGGLFAFSLNDHALSDPEIAGALNAARDLPHISILHEEYGDHLPGIGLNAKIFVLKRTA